MVKNHYYQDNEDIKLYMKYIFDKETIIKEYEGDWDDSKVYKETNDDRFSYAPDSLESASDNYEMILDAFGDLSGNYLSQVAKTMDEQGVKFNAGKVEFPPELEEMWEKFQEAGLLPYSLRRENQGLGIPIIIQSLCSEMSGRADLAFSMAMGLASLSETIERYGTREQIEKFIPKMAAGDYGGAMALSEPNYGSDLPNVKTKAVKQEDGTYLITGTKVWITNGCGVTKDRPAVILTLARTGEPDSGARGLSFFIVDGKDVEIVGIEHKMGIRSSPTCTVAYENAPATIIGEEGFGLIRYAMGMMNVARIGVATVGVSLSVAAFEEAKKYAGEREQFGKVIKDIPAVKKILERMEREVYAMRALNLETARTIDMYKWREARLLKEGKSEREVRKDEQVKFWDKIAVLFTPLSKFYTTEKANQLTYDSIQIHAGVGFTEEFDVAKLYRDARILSIYEGTTQLQVVAAIGGIVSGLTDKGILRYYLDEMMGKYTPSNNTKLIREKIEALVEEYKNIEKAEDRDYVAFEVVDSTSRFIAGMIFEFNTNILNDKGEKEIAAKRFSMVEQYNIDTLATIESSFVKLRSSRAIS